MAMVKDVYYGKTLRKSYQKHDEVLKMPNMLRIQKDSYENFLKTGLQEVFRDVGTITDYSGNLELSFLDVYKRQSQTSAEIRAWAPENTVTSSTARFLSLIHI